MNCLPRLSAAVVATAIGAFAASASYAQAPTARPDFNGIWGAGIGVLKAATCGEKVDGFNNEAVDRFATNDAKGGAKWIAFEQDCGVQRRGRVSKPMYKPQWWDKVRKSDYYANAGGDYIEFADPQWAGLPLGMPRLGPPNQIVQLGDQMFFLYENQNQFRSVPTDCREHDPVLKYDQTVNGLSVGCWDGQTLVVTSMGFTDQTWLDWPGYIHSNEMVIVERLRRDGDVLTYEVTVDDPVMFLEPWKMDTIRLNINKTPGAQLMQDVPYIDRSLGKLADPAYRG